MVNFVDPKSGEKKVQGALYYGEDLEHHAPYAFGQCAEVY